MPEHWPKQVSLGVIKLGPDEFIIRYGKDFRRVSGSTGWLREASSMEEAVEIADTMAANMDKWLTHRYPYSEDMKNDPSTRE